MPPHSTWHFGPFVYDPTTGDLRGPDGTLRLHDKPGRVLEALAEANGAVVSRETLQQRLWPEDTHVDFANNLHAAVKRLRDALGDRAGEPIYVATIPRKGYRLLVQATRVASEPPTAIAAPATEPVNQAQRRRSWWGALAILILLLTFTWMLVAYQPERAARLPEGKIMPAVLPLKNYQATETAEQVLFVDGLTEELIAHLGRLQPQRLGVIARTSAMTYRDSQKTVATIGAELGVDFILEGGFRQSGAQGRISLRLIQVHDQTPLWSEHYNVTLEDLLAVQNQIAEKVAKTLALELLDGVLPAVARANLSDTRAYQAYLRGRDAWFEFNADGYERAERHFEQALALAPKAAIVHAALADTYNLQAFTGRIPQATAFEKAKASAQVGLELDPDSAEAHNALAFALLYHDRNYRLAEFHFRQALDLNPGYAMAYHWYAGLLSAEERHDEAVTAMTRSLALDPASLSLRSDLGWYYVFAGEDEHAVEAFKQTLAVNPNYGWAVHGLAVAYQRLGLDKQAAYTLRQALQLNGESVEATAFLDGPDAAAAWRQWLEQRYQGFGTPAHPTAETEPLDAVMTCAALGHVNEAFTWLDLAPDHPWLIFLRVDPRFHGLRGDPRFATWCERLGLAVDDTPKP